MNRSIHSTQSTQTSRTAAALLLASLAVFTMAGCSKKDDSTTVGNQVDSAIAKTEKKADELKADASKEMAEAKVAASDMAKDAKQGMAAASDKAGVKIDDAMITTSVNAELAKDSSLSALKINVDTSAGKVALKGTAPSKTARDRATTLAMGVKGVVSVDNQLTVEAAKM